jgi:hypothetical protein
LTFKGLHGVISKETDLFVTIAARKSNPTTLMGIPSVERVPELWCVKADSGEIIV